SLSNNVAYPSLVHLSHPTASQTPHLSWLGPTKDPYAVLLAKLSGLSSPPKARQAFQQYMRESYAEKIAPVVAKRWEKERGENGMAAAAAEQKALGERAKAEAQAAKASYVASLNSAPPETPEARQKSQCIHGLHATLLVGGPMPALGGELSTLHYSYGRNKTTSGAHWGQWDKPRFTNHVQNFMVEYLRTAFNDSDADSEDEEETARTRKKRKLEAAQAEKQKRGAGKKKVGKKAAAKATAGTSTNPSQPSRSLRLAPPILLSPSTPASVATNPSDLPASQTAAAISEEQSDGEESGEETVTSAPVVRMSWHITEEERQRVI
ncbi:hypothetical protein B0H13DRAFT_2528785, partial [Mycena leptocephala]